MATNQGAGGCGWSQPVIVYIKFKVIRKGAFNMTDNCQVLMAGEQGIVVEFGTVIDAKIIEKVHLLASILKTKSDLYIKEVVPTYRSLLIYYDALYIDFYKLKAAIEKEVIGLADLGSTKAVGRLIRIPVCYGDTYGPDIEFVAQHNGLTVDEVIKIHTEAAYQVYMIGFTPGFPYLGGMSPKISTPRLEVPRTKIPKGSVGIAGNQTGFYPIESPGGWRIIGRTPIEGFNPKAKEPFVFNAGDYLQFVSISEAEFEDIRKSVEAGKYILAIEPFIKEVK